MSNIGLYYYKLVSEYVDDVTKNCKLTVNEIDHNFKTLKDADIKSAELDEKNKAIILTRNDGDKYIVDLSPILSGAVYDLKIEYDNPLVESGTSSGASVYVTYSVLDEKDEKVEVSVPIEGLITTNNIDSIYGAKILTRVITDESLVGNGTIKNPLGVSENEKSTPAIRLIDKTIGEELPLNPTKRDKYITKEKVSDLGLLYDYKAVESIISKLKADGSEWRVPTKSDWDCLLSSVEPCDYVDEDHYAHEDTRCHKMLGKYAGKKLKSKCGWEGQEECECRNTTPFSDNHCEETGDTGYTYSQEGEGVNDDIPYFGCSGVDEFGMRILPTGYMDEYDKEIKLPKKSTVFWTNSYVCDSKEQDIYVKRFDFDKCGVIQEAQCPNDFYSLRLVKDYDGSNYYGGEIIDDLTYETVLFPECGQIWTETNFYREYENCERVEDEKYDRLVFFVNFWNGEHWVKRALKEGESIVIVNGNKIVVTDPETGEVLDTFCPYNIEYRVFLESDENGCNNQVLVNSDDTVTERVLKVVLPLLREEREERIAADEALAEAITELDEKLDAEISARTDVDNQLWDAINAEISARTDVDNQLWDAIAQEAAAREEVDNQQWDAIAQEASARTDVDNQLWDAIAQEAAAREEVDNQQWDAIAQEASARTDVDNQLWDAIAQEAAAREEVDNQQWAAIENEARIREEIDNQQWDAINNEIARAKAREDEIDGQLIDVSKNPYILSVNPTDSEYNLTFESKDGNEDHFIRLKINSDFGSF